MIGSVTQRPARALLLAVGVLATLLALSALLASRSTDGPARSGAAPSALALAELELAHPSSIEAGEQFSVRAVGDGLTGDVVLSIDSGYGPRVFAATALDGAAEFIVPPALGPAAGLAVLDVSGAGWSATSTMQIVPGPADDPLALYLGPRTIEVGSGDVAMAVAIPVDRWGNPVAAGTEVVVSVARPDGTTETREATTRDLLAYAAVTSRTSAGRTIVTATAGDAVGPSRNFDEVASTAEPFSIELLDPLPLADGQSLFRVRTSVLTDRFANPLPDGTAGIAEVRGVTGTRQIHTHTIDGRLQFTIEAPAAPGAATIIVFASGGESAPLELDFGSAVSDIPLTVIDEGPVVRVLVGPVTGPTGAHVLDGTEVDVVADGVGYTVALERGRADMVFAELATIELEVLGTLVSEEVPSR